MAYNSEGNRPFEAASKSNHIHIIKDSYVQDFLSSHSIINDDEIFEIDENLLIEINSEIKDSVDFIVAVDGGRTEVPIKARFPSSTITFFQFGANLLSIKDLQSLKVLPFISPESISKLKELQRIKFTLPTKNIGLSKEDGSRHSLLHSVRMAVYDFFKENDLLDTLKWFLFEEYNITVSESWTLASHPLNSTVKDVIILRSLISNECKFQHPDGVIYLTDVFRFHEVVDEEIGAGGIVGYIQNLFEHFILINTIRGVAKRRVDSLEEVVFIKDGPLGFFGQTANLHQPMRKLISYLSNKSKIYIVGAEKSGPFVDHATMISHLIPNGNALLLSNAHIYKYIKPGNADDNAPYGSSSYYSGKIIFKSKEGRMYVLTIPTLSNKVIVNPKIENYIGLRTIIKYIDLLKSDMYDNALLPVALVNKLVSLSDHPSSMLLEKFAKKSIK